MPATSGSNVVVVVVEVAVEVVSGTVVVVVVVSVELPPPHPASIRAAMIKNKQTDDKPIFKPILTIIVKYYNRAKLNSKLGEIPIFAGR